jgi:hypothetical protein
MAVMSCYDYRHFMALAALTVMSVFGIVAVGSPLPWECTAGAVPETLPQRVIRPPEYIGKKRRKGKCDGNAPCEGSCSPTARIETLTAALCDRITGTPVLYSLFQAKEAQFCVDGLPIVSSSSRLNPHLSTLAVSQVYSGSVQVRAL